MFQIVFITIVCAVAAFGFIFLSTTSEGTEESSGQETRAIVYEDRQDAA